MADKTNEKMVPKDLGSLIPGLLGFGAQIGTAIPGLRKPTRTNAAEGAILAATTGAARAAAGAGSAGYGATRGLATREAGRQAQQVMLSAAPSIVQAANADEIRYQKDLQARNARLTGFGTQLAAGLSTLGAGIGTMVAGQEEEAAPAQAPAPVQDPTTGLRTQPEPFALSPEAQQAVYGQAPGAAAPAAAQPAAPTPQAAAPQAQPAAVAPPVQPVLRPDLSAGGQSRMRQAHEIAARTGEDPVLVAAHLDRYLSDPYMNPAASLNPYR